jgi:predicted porin
MTSLKKLTAVLAVSLPLAAVAQAPAAPAAPAKPLYQIYGTLNVNFQVSEATGSFAPSATGALTAAAPANDVKYRFGVSSDSTNIGIRGTADVAHGLGVVYQCETAASIDLSAGSLCGRNSRLGLSSGFGTLFYGNWDTPYKAAWYGTKADDPFGNTDVFDAAGIMGSPGFKTKSSAGVTGAAPAAATFMTPTALGSNGTFAVRAANSVAYHSPKVMGATFRAQYSANEFADNDLVLSPELYSAGVNYDMGPFSVLAAYERHMDWNGQRTVDDGWKAGVGYELGTPFGTTTIAVNGELLTFKNDAATGAALEEWSRIAGFVGLKHRTGNHEFRARYSLADQGDCDLANGATCNLDRRTGAQQYALGYAYHLSKAAQVYGFWTQIENEARASYTFATAGIAAITPGTATSPGPGADPWAAGLGMRYAF